MTLTQIGKVPPLSMQDGQTKYLKDVFHVPTIIKNLVSIGQMVEQGLQVTFNPNGCFVKDMKNQSKLIAKGERNGRMFTLDVNMLEVNSMLFTHGKGVGDIGIWHKRVGHVNLQRLKLMEKQNLVGGLPKFGTEEVMLEVPNSNNSCKFQTFGNDPLRCVDHEDRIHWRMQVLREFH